MGTCEGPEHTFKRRVDSGQGLGERRGDLTKQEVMLMLCNFSAYLPPLNQCSNENNKQQNNNKPCVILRQAQFCAGFSSGVTFCPLWLGC